MCKIKGEKIDKKDDRSVQISRYSVAWRHIFYLTTKKDG